MESAWDGVSAACAAVSGWIWAVLPVVWGWTWEALGASFLALRLGLYAFLVCVAWVRIIEEEDDGSIVRKGPQRVGRALSREALKEFDASAAGGGRSQRGPRRQSPTLSEQSSLPESIEDWSIWDEGSESEAGSDEAPPAAPPSPSPAARHSAALLPAAVTPSASSQLARPSVTANKVPTSVEQHKAVSQKTAAAEAVLTPEVAELADDDDEKQMLAGAALAATGEMVQVGTEVVQDGKTGRQGKKKRKKKSWVNRKISEMFKPMAEKYHAAGYMMYRGFNRMGKHMERGAGILGKQLDGAIRDVGASAVQEGERMVKKWVKFFGVVAFLTVALLPLPNVHVKITAG